MRFSKDEPPIPLTDFRKVEDIKNPNRKILWKEFNKETGRSVSKTMYLLALPDELKYIEWLEIEATKLQILKENSTSL